MTTEDFLDILEDRQLVSDSIVRQLRDKVAKGDHRITAKSILKFLVKKELVTRDQAKQLLETTLTVSPGAESSILGLVPMPKAPNKPPAPEPPSPKPPSASSDDVALAASSEDEAPAEAKPEPSPEIDDPSPLGSSVPDLGAPVDLATAAGLDSPEADYDPLTEEAAADAKGSSGKSRKKKRKKRGRRKKDSEWDSPLLLIGFAALALLLVAGGLIYYLLFRENADKLLAQASDAFSGGSYSQAITLYEKFVEQHSSHPDISDARVRLGMSKLWRDTEGKSDFTRALDTALEVTDSIQDEPAFNAGGDDESGLSQAKREMSELLTKIAVGLANQAEASDDNDQARQLIEKAKTAIGLTSNTKLVPQRFRLATELDMAKETLERVQRRLTRDADLAAAIAAMDAAMAKGDSATAFAEHKALLDQYPRLFDNEQLAAKIREVAAAEQALVKFAPASQAAATDESPSPLVAALALADRSGPAAPDAAGATAVAVDGNLYGISLVDGELLWRRRLGIGHDTAQVAATGSRVIAVDADRQQIICVETESGDLAWRQPLGEQPGPLTVRDEHVLVAGESGHLFVIDAESGEMQGRVEFGQPVAAPPTFSSRGDRVYVVGDHSNLYTLSTDDWSCQGVHYLGHARGSIVAPVLVVLNKLAIAENLGVETSQLHIIGLDKRGVAEREITRQRLRGLVLSPLMNAGRRFAALTTLGGVSVYEVGSGDDETALTELAQREPSNREQTIPFGMMREETRETSLWIADHQLQKLAVLPTGGRLPLRPLPESYEGDIFDHPLIETERLLIHVRRKPGTGGVVVGAVDFRTGEPAWQTVIAATPAGAPAVDAAGQRITAVSATGACYLLDRQSFAARVQNDSTHAEGETLTRPLTRVVDLGGGRLVAGAVGSPTMLHFRPQAPRGPATFVTAPAPLATPPVALANGFLAPTKIGQVFYYSAEDGGQAAAPFQPTLTPGQEVAWLPPAAVPGDSPAFAISDGETKVYLVELAGEGADRQLRLSAEADVGTAPLETSLVATDGFVVAGNAQGDLATYALPDLRAGQPVALGGRITWGPYPVGGLVLAGLDTEELVAVEPGGGVAWRQPLAAPFAPGALPEDGTAWVLDPAGACVQISMADGSEAARIELGQPAVAGPTPFGPRLVVAAPDGSLLVVDRPH